jgi:hypothetical protein
LLLSVAAGGFVPLSAVRLPVERGADLRTASMKLNKERFGRWCRLARERLGMAEAQADYTTLPLLVSAAVREFPQGAQARQKERARKQSLALQSCGLRFVARPS